MITTLVFVGPHGSGKTTLGQLVAEELGWQFDLEIGEQMRLEALEADPSAHTCRPQADFDQKVITRELARDRAAESGGPRVVETWHPGNLAYARQRNPEVFASQWPDVEQAVASGRATVLVQPLMIDGTTLEERLREPGPDPATFIPWLRRVGEEAADIARGLGLTVLPPLATDRCPVEEAVRLVVGRVRAEGGVGQGIPEAAALRVPPGLTAEPALMAPTAPGPAPTG